MNESEDAPAGAPDSGRGHVNAPDSLREGAEEALGAIEGSARKFIEDLGGILIMAGQTVVWALRPPYRGQNLFIQLEFVGVQSIFVVALTGLFSGMVFALQTYHAFSLFNAQSLVGSTVALSLARELAPVFAGLMVTARVGSAMATELGSMRVTEQIDALATMAVDPFQYLVVPRVLATVLMMPVLTMLFDIVGITGAYVVAVYGQHLAAAAFLGRIHSWVDPNDIIGGLIKAAVFGLIISLISCYKGFNARGGAKGVGVATTEAVVMASVSIMIVDYFLSALLVNFWSRGR
jgi:phospholipid/cholesterol/gamma-HCH transport system permease protein